MGIDSNHARFLLAARKRGVNFRRTVMLGRQFCVLNAGELQSLLQEFGYPPDDRVLQAANAYAEPFIQFLGAEEIISVDASPYQNASFIHDMNLPIPPQLRGRFDAVVDGGALEHIFNFPTAIRNCMEMLAPNGHFLGVSPANNFCGHGFYQFSPDLFFRIFTAENGFRVERAIVCEVEPHSAWFEVHDPLAVRQSVNFHSLKPTYLLVQARKLADRPLFVRTPQQSGSRPDVCARDKDVIHAFARYEFAKVMREY